MTSQSLVSITDHPKIAVTKEEYRRINSNLRYYQSKWDEVTYRNTDGESKKRKMAHLPIARTASKKIASLVFNEQAEITVNDDAANDYLSSILGDENELFNKNFERYLESALALGGLAMRPYIDETGPAKRVKVAFVQAPVFLPLQSNTQTISSAAIVNKTRKGSGREMIYYTLIEFHEWMKDGKYTITNELYKSKDESKVGDRVPLSEAYEELEEHIELEGLTRPLFTYLRNPGMNNKDINSPLGLSIFDNAKSTIDFLNATFDEFKWEVKMGQRRVGVSDGLTRMTIHNENGDVTFVRRFDAEQNVYQMIGGEKGEGGVTDLTTPIRANDYISVINHLLSIFEMEIGISQGTFTFDGQALKTATEVVSENSDTYQMRNSIVALVQQSIKELVVSIFELSALYGLYAGKIPTMDEITVNLDDGVFTDKAALLDYWLKAYAAGLTSKKRAIMKAFQVTDVEAGEIMKEISSETIESSNMARSSEDVDVYGE